MMSPAGQSWLKSIVVASVLSTSVALLGVAATRETDADYFMNLSLLRQLQEVDALGEAQVLRAFIGIGVDYDALVASMAETARLSNLVGARVGAQPHSCRGALDAALGRLDGLERDKTAAVEQFKSDNAIVRNSLAFLPTAHAELVAAHRAAGGAPGALADVDAAFVDVLTRTRSLSREDGHDVEEILARVAAGRASLPARDGPLLDVFLVHARTALGVQRRVDALVRDIARLDVSARIDEIAGLLGAEQRQRSRERVVVRNGLVGFATLALGLFILAALRLGRARVALGEANLQLQRANDHLELRVVQRTSELNDANLIVRNSSTILYRIGATPALALTYVSPNIARFGLDPASLMADRSWASSVVAPEHLARVVASTLGLLRGQALENTIEYRLPDALGASRWVEDRRQLVRDAQGRVLEIEGIVFDVTARRHAQIALKHSEEFTRAILDSISVEIAVLDSQGIITAVNAPWRRFAEASAAEEGRAALPTDVGSDYLAVASREGMPDDKAAEPAACAGIRDVLEGRRARFELEYSCHSPRLERWFRMSVTPLGIAARGVVVTHEDITLRRSMEEELRRSNELLATALETLPCGMCVFDAETRLVAWNAEYVRLLDLPPGLFEGAATPRLQDVVHYLAEHDEYGAGDVGALVRQTLHRLTASASLHFERIRPNGATLEIRTARMPGGGVVATFTDISAARDAEASAQRSTRLLRSAIEAIDEAFVLFGPDQRLVFCNKEYRDLYGSLAHLVVTGATYDDLHLISRTSGVFRTVSDDEPATSFAQLSEDGFQPHSQLRRLADGRVLRATSKAMPEGHRVGILTDVTELLKASEIAEQALLAKGQFLANISHEVRTPMNAILGVLALLQRTALGARQRDYVERTDGAARALLGVLNAVLDYSKIEAGALSLDAHPFELEAMLRELALIVSANVGSKALDLRFDVDPEVPDVLVGDAMRLQQVLVNLVGNAVKFTHQGFVELSIRVQQQRASGVSLVFAVRDTGIGIAPENRMRIFAGFTQAEASITRRFGGTGLGLAISHRLVELMGGVLRVDSTVGAGSTFEFAIDFATPTPAPSRRTAAGADDPPLRVLVLARAGSATEGWARMGRALRWQFEVVADDEGAPGELDALRSAVAFDLAVVDAPLADEPGPERPQRSGGRTGRCGVPVLRLGSLRERELVWADAASIDAGVGFLVKPFTADMFRSAARAQVAGSEPDASAAAPASIPGRLCGLRILLVEDNATNQLVARELLEAEGALIAIASDGEQAVRALASYSDRFDAVLMDLQMPMMDGLTAAARIRDDLGQGQVPIIAMSANTSALDRQACLAAGMVDHIGKPFDLDDLVELLRLHSGRSPMAAPGPSRAAAIPPSVLAAATQACVDVVPALARLKGDLALYAGLLATFVAQSPAFIADLRGWAGSDDRAAARAALHTIKGLGATLGADSISRAAAAAEASCSEDGGGGAAGEAMLVACRALTQGQTGLKALQAACEGVAPHAVAAVEPLAVELIVSRLERIAGLLLDSDMGAFALISALRLHAGGALARELAELDGHAVQLRFQAAIALCNALIARLRP